VRQDQLEVISKYSKSGGVLLLNPTDRHIQKQYRLTGYSAQAHSRPAQIARKPAVIRGTPPNFIGGTAAATITFTNMSPATAVHGVADLTVTLTGTGFTTNTVLLWNGSPDGCTFVNATTITTVVKPSLVSVAVTVPVALQQPGQLPTATRNFVFT
jgi:IPT/TIG domain